MLKTIRKFLIPNLAILTVFLVAQDGDDYMRFGKHTIENCIAMAEGRQTYMLNGDEYAVWADPNLNCGYVLDAIGYGMSAFMCTFSGSDGKMCAYQSDDPNDPHMHCEYMFPDGKVCGAPLDSEHPMEEHMVMHDAKVPSGGDCDEGYWWCDMCGKCVPDDSEAKSHIMDKHGG